MCGAEILSSLMLRFCLQGSDTVRSRSYVQVQSSSVAQAACDLELWDCCSIGYYSADHFAVTAVAFGSFSRVTVSLRHHVQCVASRTRAWIGRVVSLHRRYQLLLPAPVILA